MGRGPVFSSLADMTEWGLRGASLSRGRLLVLRGGAIVGFLAVWSLVSGAVVLFKLFNPIFLPGPWMVLGKVVQLAANGQLWEHVGATLWRVLVGFTTGALLALALGLPAGHLRAVRNALEPIVELFRPIPPLAMLPLFIVWVGIGETSKIAFITYATFFPMFLTTVHAVQQVDPLLLRAAASLGARRPQLFFRGAVDNIGSGGGTFRVHPHIQRPRRLEGKSSLRSVQLEGGHAQIGQ